ncbi:MAG: hypothetical protein A2046_12480 [Bacteroidetes bacterium GWA2_30_7]|nr:MAG: hypothetical protein A2046_12480 [Bacteroidetes bacterium GWA2_30_7]
MRTSFIIIVMNLIFCCLIFAQQNPKSSTPSKKEIYVPLLTKEQKAEQIILEKNKQKQLNIDKEILNDKRELKIKETEEVNTPIEKSEELYHPNENIEIEKVFIENEKIDLNENNEKK